MQQWQRQKVSDAEQRIENRLAELHRSMVEDNSQSASASQVQGSIHTPESDDKRYLSPSAKVRQKVYSTMGESLNRSKFVENYRSPDWMKF